MFAIKGSKNLNGEVLSVHPKAKIQQGTQFLDFQFFFLKRLEDIAKRKRKREQVQKALERTFKEDTDDVWIYHTRQSNQGTMEFVNLAFEPGKPDDQLKS